MYFVETLAAICAPQRNVHFVIHFSEITNYEPNNWRTCHEPWLIWKMWQFILIYDNLLQFMTIYFNSFLFRVLLLQFSLCTWLWPPQKDVCCMAQVCTKFFSTLNFTIIFIKSFTCITMQPLPFFNEVLFPYETFSQHNNNNT